MKKDGFQCPKFVPDICHYNEILLFTLDIQVTVGLYLDIW